MQPMSDKVGRWVYERALHRVLPWRAMRSYLLPLLHPRRRSAYDGPAFWRAWYGGAVTDAATISPRARPDQARYHYAVTEAAVVRALYSDPPHAPHVLDVGSGAGHWLRFWRETYDAEVAGLDISPAAVAALTLRGEQVTLGDVTEPLPGGPYDLVCAVGVLFHIVDDGEWRRALRNIAAALVPEGRAVVGGEFGRWTHDAQVFRDPQGWRVNKRLRSLGAWRRAAAGAGLRIESLTRSRPCWAIVTPQADVMVLRRCRPGGGRSASTSTPRPTTGHPPADG